MPLDKVILDHIRDMDKIEDVIDNEIEFLFNNINIDEFIENPEQALEQFNKKVQTIIIDNHLVKAVENGIDLADAIEKDGSVEIVDSDNPNENKDISEQAFGKDFNDGKED